MCSLMYRMTTDLCVRMLHIQASIHVRIHEPVPLHLIPLRQGLSLSLERGWQLLQFLPPQHWGYRRVRDSARRFPV